MVNAIFDLFFALRIGKSHNFCIILKKMKASSIVLVILREIK